MPKYSHVFHQVSKQLFHGTPLQPEPGELLEGWPEMSIKKYTRLPKVALSTPTLPPETSLAGALEGRESRTDFSSPVSLQELSVLLKYSCGEWNRQGYQRKLRSHPSAGARFPLEVYPLVLEPDTQSGDALLPGLYHYDAADHQLDVLTTDLFTDFDSDAVFTYDWTKRAAVVFFITGVFWRTQHMYKERGYRYVLIEAGHVSQNLYLVAEALGMKCCALGGTRDECVEKFLDVDGETESLVFSVAVGK